MKKGCSTALQGLFYPLKTRNADRIFCPWLTRGICFMEDLENMEMTQENLEPEEATVELDNENNDEEKEGKKPGINVWVVLKNVFKDVLEIAIITVVMFFIFTHIIDISQVMSASMEPTLMTGDITVFNKLDTDVERGDIIKFEKDNEFLSKRVIGLPGDKIEITEAGEVMVNGEVLKEDYLPADTTTAIGNQNTYEVPEDCLFVLGDNRVNSYDSRYWEDPFVEMSKVIGTEVVILN